jgi:Domain of unknown function (DUF4157)
MGMRTASLQRSEVGVKHTTGGIVQRESNSRKANTPGAYFGNQAALRRASRAIPRLQCKLEIGAVNDPLEAEADHVADRVMRMAEPSAATRDTGGTVRRMCPHCQKEHEEQQTVQRSADCGVVRRMCPECTKEEDEKKTNVQRKSDGGSSVSIAAPPLVSDVLSDRGQPLGAYARSFFEPRFGADFGGVRIHDHPQAAASAHAIGALAYTYGQHIVFGDGQFSMQSSQGRELLAHELVHTLQQGLAPEPSTGRLSTEPEASPAEQEADQVASLALGSRGPASQQQASVASSGASVAARRIFLKRRGAAAGCGVCIPDPTGKAAGVIAHTEIQAAFLAINALIQKEFPVPTAPMGEPAPFTPEVDLVLEDFHSDPTRIYIGEIKPLDDAGEQVGIARKQLQDYARELQASGYYGEVFRLSVPPPPIPIPFLNPAHPPGCPPQMIMVQLTEPGIYQYYCDPAWSDLVTDPRCACGKKQEDEEEQDEKQKDKKTNEEEEDEKEKGKEKEKDKNKEDDKGNDKEEDTDRRPRPEVLVPVAAFALLAAAAAMMAKFAGRRVTGAIAAIAAIVLISSGAEASVGGEGDDALEAMFKLAEQKGATIPDDLKDAIRNDPELKKILTQAGQSGNYSDAKRQLGEKLTRVIAENRDQFTDEEIEALLKVTGDNQGAIPNGDITVQSLRKALDARRSGAAANPPAAGKDSDRTQTDPAQAPDNSAQGNPPANELPPPAKRLVGALTSGTGPKLNAQQAQRLESIVRSVTPALTDAEVDTLIARIASGENKSADQLLDSIQQTLQQFRAQKPASDAGAGDSSAAPADPGAKDSTAQKDGAPTDPTAQKDAGATDPANAGADTGDKKPKAPDAAGPSVPVNSAATKTQNQAPPLSDEAKKTNDQLDQKYDWVGPGEGYVFGDASVVFKDGVPFNAFFVARDDKTKRVLLGKVKVTPKKAGAGWTLIVSPNSPLYDASGQWGVTKRLELPAIAGAGQGKTEDKKPAGQ